MPWATRRRFLTVTAATACLGLGGSGRPELLHRWEGSALGANASLTLHHPDPRRARPLIEAAISEIDRLERIFSLQRADSAIGRLNREGRLAGPPLELVAVLETAARVSSLSDGAFDVTVQPLWRLYALRGAPPPRLVEAAGRLVDWRQVEASASSIALGRPGMAVTLNGIAQGYITDRVADLLRDAGLEHALVDLGEQRAIGARPEGEPWRIGTSAGQVRLADGAVASSGPVSDGHGRSVPNLINPHDGSAVSSQPSTVIVARRAIIADALSTALAVADPETQATIEARLAELGAFRLA